MNKYLYILGFAGAALFSACSNSDDLSIGESPAVDKAKESVLVYEAGQNSEVPITLGISQSRGLTRKPLDPDDTDGNFSTEVGKHLGVFCLATGYQTSYESNPPITNNWKDDNTGILVRMNNAPASVSGGDVTLTGDFYYPMANWMKYNFYTYYPRQEETVNVDGDDKTTLVFTDDQVLEKYYEIDGSQDIIWGKANPSNAIYNDAPDDAKPFSAGYFRWKKNHLEVGDNIANYSPQFKFEHKLVQFRFFVRAANATALAKNIRVRDMNITNGINRLELVVADKNSSENNGKLYWFGNSIKTERMSIKLTGSNVKRFDQDGVGGLDHPFAITNVAIDVEHDAPVGYIMLAPPTVRGINSPDVPNDLVYRLVVKVRYTDGGTINEDIPFLLNPADVGLEAFEAGKIYNIVISIDV